jgi:iron complex transport system substrate-binding protein
VVPRQLDDLAGDSFYGTVSRERADLLDADVLLFQAGSAEGRASIEADPILSALPVVAEGRSLFIDGSAYDAIQFSSALSLPYLLESFVPELAAVVATG